jgi:hypothetical protein
MKWGEQIIKHDMGTDKLSKSCDSTTDTFEYDNASRLTSAFKDRHDITVNRAYFPDGTMRSESYVLDNRTYTLERTYDERNLVDTQTFADGKVMSWDHDSRRLVTDVHDMTWGQTNYQ